MRVKISYKRTLFIWLVAFVLGAILIFLFGYETFLRQWTAVQPIIISGYVILMVILFFVGYKTNYYIIDKKELIVVKFRKQYVYPYDKVIFLDEKEINKGKTITMVLDKGIIVYINQDENKEVAKTLLKKCHNLLSKEELKKQYPHIKL